MTNEELFTDLKQFIEATVSQQIAHLASKDDLEGVKQQISDVEQRLNVRIDTIDEKIDVIHNAIGETVQDHEQRLRRLETKAA